MTLPLHMLRRIAQRLMIMSLMVLIVLGMRTQVVLGGYLFNIPPAPVQNQGPIHEEEEEHRHDAKAASTVERRNNRHPIPPAGRLIRGLLPDLKHPSPTFILPRVLPESESDYRNGLGAPLRC